MTDATTDQVFELSSKKAALMRAGLVVVWAIVTTCAIIFIFAYATQYFVHYDATTFGPYWPRRGALLLHIGGAVVALLTAPWQFWSGYRRMPMTVHRWTGRIFVAAVALGSVSAAYLSLTTTFGWAFGLGTISLNVAWVATTGMAVYAIRHRLIDLHKQWMIRAYVVTFAFVIIRLFNDVLPTSVFAGKDLAITMTWAGWVAPLFATELILQLTQIRKTLRRTQRPASVV
jgi:uncharacterized membrane protein